MELTLKSYQSSFKGDASPLLVHCAGPGQELLWPSESSRSTSTTRRRKKKKSKLSTSSCPAPARAYLEKPDPVYDFFNKVLGSLPVIGLFSRLISDEGGVGADRVQFKEFCSRVYRSFSPDVPQAFFEFENRHGTAARPQYVLLWCWAAALGAGLLRTEDMMLGATRLRVSFDIQYEEENLNILMDEAAKKRKKAKSVVPFVPYEVRAIKALDGICKCCIATPNMEEEDARLITIILQAVFPAANKEEIEKAVRDKILSAEGKESEEVEDEAESKGIIEQGSIFKTETSLDYSGALEEQGDVLEASQFGKK